MANTSKIAYELIKNFNYSSRPQNLVDILTHYFIEQECFQEIVAFEKASDIADKIENELFRIEQQQKKDGIISPFEIIRQDSKTILIGSAYSRPSDTVNKRKIRETIPSIGIILNELYNLEPLIFEKFCSRLLEYIGAIESNVTKSSGDDGVDFLAKFQLENPCQGINFLGFESAFFFYIYGQAKRYEPNRSIGPDVIRELIGAVSMIKYDEALGRTDKKRSIRLRLCDPVQLLLFTTGKFSSSSIEMAETAGVVLKDGEQLSTYIAVNRIGFTGNTFNITEFKKWLGL